MTATLKDEFILVRTKTGQYYHPVRGLSPEQAHGEEGWFRKHLGCQDFPTSVTAITDEERESMKPCIRCAMWIVYGQERPPPERGRNDFDVPRRQR